MNRTTLAFILSGVLMAGWLAYGVSTVSARLPQVMTQVSQIGAR